MTHYIKTPLLAIVLAGTTAFAQQTVPFTQFWTTQLQTNPATAGLNYKYNAYLTYSSAETPAENQLGAHAGYAMKIARINSGVGISSSFDGTSTAYSQNALLHYAYHFELGGSTLALGASGGARFRYIDWDKLTYGDLIYPDQPNDPLLPTTNRQTPRTSFEANAGIAYNWKDLNAGFSITQADRYFDHEDEGFDPVPQYWLTADYTFHLPAKIDLRPQVQVMTDNVTWYHMVSLMALYNNRLWIGANYRHDHLLGVMAGYDFRERFRVGAGYNLVKSQLNNSIYHRSCQVVLSWTMK